MKVKDEPLFQKRETVSGGAGINGSVFNALFPGEAPSSGEAAKRFFDNLGIPIAILDRDLKFVYGNRAFSDVFGFFPDLSSGGQRFSNHFRRLNHDGFESWWAEIQWFDYRQFDGIFEFVAADGLPRVYKVIFSRHEDGAYYTAAFINITAEERQRTHLRKRLGHSRSLLVWLTRFGQARNREALFDAFCAFAREFWRLQNAVWINLDWAAQKWHTAFVLKNGKIVTERTEFPWNDTLPGWFEEASAYRLCAVDELQALGLEAALPAQKSMRAVLLPLYHEARVQSVIVALGSEILDAVAPEEMRLVGEHVQMAYDRVRLADENRQFRRWLKRAASEKPRSTSLEALGEAIGQQVRELAGCRAVGITVLKDGKAEISQLFGLDAHAPVALPDWAPEQWLARLSDEKPLIWQYPEHSADFSDEARRFLDRHGLHWMMALGAQTDDGRLVILSGYWDAPPPLDSLVPDMFAACATQAVQQLQSSLMLRALKHSRDFMEGILKHSAYAIICTDRHGRITYYSQGAKQMLGYGEEEVIGREVSEFWLENPAQIRQMLSNIGEHDKILDYETYLKHKNGHFIPFSLSLAALYDDAGRISGYLGIGRDISEKKKAEEELQQRREELEDLIYLITHNLKSPIVSVEGFANLLIEEAGPRLDEESFKYLDRIKKNVESMNTMISDLLEFSKYGKMDMTLERINLQQVVLELIEEIQVQFAPVKVQVEIPEPLPDVVAHGEGIKTVFENLLNNAAKYRKPDQEVQIKIWFEEKPRFYAFHIEDNGIGIEPEAQKKIFNLFQRAANVADVHGTGVGLAICKRIVTRQGGFITVHSTPGQGTRFSFTLPKRELDAVGAASTLQAE